MSVLLMLSAKPRLMGTSDLGHLRSWTVAQLVTYHVPAGWLDAQHPLHNKIAAAMTVFEMYITLAHPES
jgi:hypothetical protein